MRVRNIEIVTSPLASDRVRLQGDVVCENPSVAAETYWFDFPASCAQDLTASGDSWLVLLLPLAVKLGEPLSIPRPVDRELFENVHELMRVWQCWDSNLRPVPIEAELIAPVVHGARDLTASLFSGGVDAWFTLLTNNGEPRQPGARHIDELLTIWGFDVSIDRPDAFQAMRNTLAQATAAFGTKLVDVATNLHETQWWLRADWGHVAHGCGLASIALALGDRYRRLLIPSTHRYDDPIPWGSHPLTDPLLSTSTTRILHDGAGFSRVVKTETIAGFDTALKSLQVCWQTKSFTNCCACSKCYRTMATLFLLGKLEQCPRFDASKFDPSRLAYVFLRDESDKAFMKEVRDLAMRKQRADVARSIERSFRASRYIALAFRGTTFLAKKPFVWRLRDPLERLLLRHVMV